MRVAAPYSHRFRYCDYLGKYFCTGCHRNHMSVIPARVLDRWEFTNRPVSVFSYRLLEEIWQLALFRVSDLNKMLYVNVRPLYYAKMIRKQLKFIQDFIVSCRFADRYRSHPHAVVSRWNDLMIWFVFVAVLKVYLPHWPAISVTMTIYGRWPILWPSKMVHLWRRSMRWYKSAKCMCLIVRYCDYLLESNEQFGSRYIFSFVCARISFVRPEDSFANCAHANR